MESETERKSAEYLEYRKAMRARVAPIRTELYSGLQELGGNNTFHSVRLLQAITDLGLDDCMDIAAKMRDRAQYNTPTSKL